jgi:hypothetical protein
MYSTETALLEILNGTYKSSISGRITTIVALDLLSAAFETTSLLVDRSQIDFGVTSSALHWLESYLGDRRQ